MALRLLLATIPCLVGVAIAAPTAFAQTAAPAIPPSVRMCMVCHKTAAADKSTIGPNLWQVGGRKAGTLPGYAYSPAMKSFAKPWTSERIDAFIADPKAVVPGTKMAYAGQRDASKRAEIVAYIMRLK